MKKIILISIIFIAVSSFCLAEEEEVKKEKIFPKSRIGATIGTGTTFRNDDCILDANGECISYKPHKKIELFYHKTLEENFMFLSFNAGYTEDNNIDDYISVAVGLNILFFPSGGFHPYYGIGIGLSNRLQPKENSNRIGFLIDLCEAGFIGQIPSINLSLHSNIKFQGAFNGTSFIGFNVGAAYLIPRNK